MSVSEASALEMKSLPILHFLPIDSAEAETLKRFRDDILVAIEIQTPELLEHNTIEIITQCMLEQATEYSHMKKATDPEIAEYHRNNWLRATKGLLSAQKLLYALVLKKKPSKARTLRDVFERNRRDKTIAVRKKPAEAKIRSVEILNNVPQFIKQKSLAKRKAEMIVRLGGHCVCVSCPSHVGKVCGATKRLEPDHIYGATWQIERYGPLERMTRYEKDERDVLLRLLCRSCNASDGARNRQGKARWKNSKNRTPVFIADGGKESDQKGGNAFSRPTRKSFQKVRPKIKKKIQNPVSGDFLSRMRVKS